MRWKKWPILKSLLEKETLLEVDLLFAQGILKEIKSETQAHAAFLSTLFALSRQGHLFLDLDRNPIESLQPLLEEAVLSFPLKTREDRSFSHWVYSAGRQYYLQKNWVLEQEIAHHLKRLTSTSPVLRDVHLMDAVGNEEQMEAIKKALHAPLSILTGGPGTGKTFTAAQIIKTFLLHQEKEGKKTRIFLSAPTGKAVAQLEQSLTKALDKEWDHELVEIQAKTLHSLLKIKVEREIQEEVFIDADLILIDECSMIDLEIFARLLSSILKGTHLVLIGDKYQLPPVGLGSLFAALIDMGYFPTTELKTTLRSDRKEIFEVAEAIKLGDIKRCAHFFSQESTDFCWEGLSKESSSYLLFEKYKQHFTGLYKDPPDPLQLLLELNRFAILSCMRKSKWGVEELNQVFLTYFREEITSSTRFWAIPIMITRNDPKLELYNGDQGILIRKIQSRFSLETSLEETAYFLDRNSTSNYRKISILSLPSYEYCYILSVHKSQGSEYDEVVILAPDGTEAFGREVLYTAVTRAKQKVVLKGSKEVLERAILSTSRKASGSLTCYSIDLMT